MTEEFDLECLRRAVDLSRRSLEAGGFPVAALLVRDHQEISCGLSSTESTRDVTAHGEIQAIRAAGANAVSPLTLYSSLEPCLMCLAASAWAGVNKIVFGCKRGAVDASYYINRGDVAEAVRFLVNPPQLLMLPDFESEIIALIREFEQRIAHN